MNSNGGQSEKQTVQITIGGYCRNLAVNGVFCLLR